MGLFDTQNAGLLSPEVEDQLRKQMLMQFGLAALQGSGPSTTPTSLGQIIGGAGMSAVSQGQSLRESAIQQALMGRRIAQEDNERKRVQDARAAAAPNVPESLRAAYELDPATAASAAALMPQQGEAKFVKDLKLPDGSTVSGYISPEGFVPVTTPVAPEPTVEEKKQVLALRTAQDTLNDLRSTFEGKIETLPDGSTKKTQGTGTEFWPSVGKTKLTSQYRNLQLQLKELFNLGVLNGPDLELMNQVLIDPTSTGANLLGSERVVASMDEVQRFIENKEKALLQSPGVRAREGDSIVDRNKNQTTNTVNWSDL